MVEESVTSIHKEEDRGDDDDAESSDSVEIVQSPLAWRAKLSYGVGHIFNDMCASMWFTYTLVYLTKVLLLSDKSAGLLMLIGQLVDAVSTPAVGFESDRTGWIRLCAIYGKRKSWHLLGTVLVLVSFPFIFIKCLACTAPHTSELGLVAYYTPFVVIFQLGWASVQISHLALVPELTACAHERITLNSIRNAFCVISNIAVLSSMWLLLGEDQMKVIVPVDSGKFMHLGFGVVGVGFLSALVFHIGTKEPVGRRTLSISASTESERRDPRMDWRHWFGEYQFYVIAALYTGTRMFINLSQAYFPLYLLDTQRFEKKYIAIFPLVIYVSSFVTSACLSVPQITRLLDKRVWFLIGLAFGTSACVWMWFKDLHNQLYGVSILLGVASSILLVMSLGMTSDLIRNSTESGAFVFGAMSFMDKLSNGLAIFVIQQILPKCSNVPTICDKDSSYFRYILVFVPGGALALACLALLSLWGQTLGVRSRFRGPTTVPPITDTIAQT